METYNNDTANELPSNANYNSNYNAYAAPESYYFPNGQYLYNSYYSGYNNYQPQFNTTAANYNQYAQYYPNYLSASASTVDCPTVVDKNESAINTSSESSASSVALSGEYLSIVSPVPSTNEQCVEQSTPIIQTLNTFYPTPPTDDSSSSSMIKENKKICSTNKSPEVIPHESDEDDENSQGSSSRVKRRTRTQFNKFQIDSLEAIFQKNHYPDVQTVDHLAEKLGLAIERISVWFQNRRAKFKKTKKPSNFSAERLYSSVSPLSLHASINF